MADQQGRVLVVDDSDIAAKQAQVLLEEAGFTADILTTPVGVEEQLLKGSYVALVVDLMLPTVTGDELAEAVHRHPALTGLPVVLMSGQRDAPADLPENTSFLRKRDVPSKLVPLLRQLLEG